MAAKRRADRPLPSTPSAPVSPESQASEPVAEVDATPTAPPPPREKEYLYTGTKCTKGHDEGTELDYGGNGTLPRRKTAFWGLAAMVGGAIGLFLVGMPEWGMLAIYALVGWQILVSILRRRAGHRGKCWRTRTWRWAWGGIVPNWETKDPTRPAGE